MWLLRALSLPVNCAARTVSALLKRCDVSHLGVRHNRCSSEG